MPRIKPLDSGDVDPETQAVFERYQRERGNIPNMFRTMAYRPEIAKTADAHLQAIFTTGTVPVRLKEMLALLQ